MIYNTLYNKIKTILEEVENVKQITEYPESKFTAYPAVVFFPSDISNVFDTSSSDFREYRFKMFVLIGVNQTSLSHVFLNVMSNTCDSILEAFRDNWDLNRIDGNRCWIRIEGGNWSLSNDDKGQVAVAEFNLVIKVSVDSA